MLRHYTVQIMVEENLWTGADSIIAELDSLFHCDTDGIEIVSVELTEGTNERESDPVKRDIKTPQD